MTDRVIPEIDRTTPIHASPSHILGKVNGFETTAIWGGPIADGGWSVSWLFIADGERTLQVTRTFENVEDARFAFRSINTMVEEHLREDMLRAAQLPF